MYGAVSCRDSLQAVVQRGVAPGRSSGSDPTCDVRLGMSNAVHACTFSTGIRTAGSVRTGSRLRSWRPSATIVAGVASAPDGWGGLMPPAMWTTAAGGVRWRAVPFATQRALVRVRCIHDFEERRSNMAKIPEKAILTLGDQQIELPVVVGTEGEKAIDITKLRDKTGYITLRPVAEQHGGLPELDHVHRRRERHPAVSRDSDRAVRELSELCARRLDAHFRPHADDAMSWASSVNC